MDTIRDFLFRDSVGLVFPLAVLAVTLVVGYAFKRLLFRLLRRWVDRTKSPAAQTFTQALDRPFMIWILILGVHLASEASDLSAPAARRVGTFLLILWIISLTIMFAGLARDLIRFYGSGIPGALPVTSLTQHLAQLGVVMLGMLVLLNLLGIPITPILTALGVGGLAVALALQDTLSNLFAGFYVAVAGQVRLGDYIKLDSGEEGYVTDISWRSTSIRALPNNLIVIPNAKLAQAIVTNFHLPEKRMSLVMPVSVAYGSDPDLVERVLIEVARQGAGEIPGLLAEPAPFVRFIPGFGESSLDFSLISQVSEFVDQFLVQHELRKRILRRFQAEGIQIPFPTRTVYVRGQGA
jgi:small-conductance mechanosensitive channel